MTTPFVPHRDRHDLHGITVVVQTDARLYVGRLDTADDQSVVLKDVGYHDDEATRDDYLARTSRFGVQRLEAIIEVPTPSVRGIRRLGD